MTIWRDMAPELSLGLFVIFMTGAVVVTFLMSR